MSGWHLICQALEAGPQTSKQLEWLGVDVTGSLRRAKGLGLIEAKNIGFRWRWSLTEAGRDYLAGRLQPAKTPGKLGRAPLRLTATWIAALPRTV